MLKQTWFYYCDCTQALVRYSNVSLLFTSSQFQQALIVVRGSITSADGPIYSRASLRAHCGGDNNEVYKETNLYVIVNNQNKIRLKLLHHTKLLLLNLITEDLSPDIIWRHQLQKMSRLLVSSATKNVMIDLRIETVGWWSYDQFPPRVA